MKFSILRKLCWLIILVAGFTGITMTQIGPEKVPAGDSANVPALDSLSVNFTKPIPLVGSVGRSSTYQQFIPDSTINFQNYSYTGDLIGAFPGIFVKETGSLGTFPDISAGGMDGRGINFMTDGIRLNDPLTGLFNLYLYPTETVERIEIISGTRAFLYGLNGTGATVNFITKSKKALKPYSRIRYSESSYGFGIIDGLVSQDIIRGLNVTAGVQHSVFGERYTNETYDCWNGRLKVRYNVNSDLNFFVSEIYNKTQQGLYGGVDISKTPDSLRYDNMQASVLNTDAYEKISRHDFQTGVAARILPDSEFISTLTFYLSSNLREYRDEENRMTTNGIFLQRDFRSEWKGIKFIQEGSVLGYGLDLGAELQSHRVLITPATETTGKTIASIFGKSEIDISSSMSLSPYTRFDAYAGKRLLSFGGDFNYSPLTSISLRVGYSTSYRTPTLLERDGDNSVVVEPLGNEDPERHTLFEAGLSLDVEGRLSLLLTTYQRVIKNAIIAKIHAPSTYGQNKYEFARDGKRMIRGIDISGSFRFGSFYLEGSCRMLESSDSEGGGNYSPGFSSQGGVYFWDKIAAGNLDLKIGVEGRYFGKYQNTLYNPETQYYFPAADAGEGSVIDRAGVLNLVILGHMGSAYIHVILDNVLDTKYVMSSFYPMPERQLRFGVSWEFLE